MEAKVIARVKGGLGNQLFCYAAARRLAAVNDAELVVDDVTGFIRDRKFRRKYALGNFNIGSRTATARERLEPFERYRRAVLKMWSRRKPFHQRRYVEQEGRDFDERLLTLLISNPVYLDGLWQSEKYFKDIERQIREDLHIQPPSDAPNREMAREIAKPRSVALHVRWFDTPDSQTHRQNVLRVYYRRAIQRVEAEVAAPRYFLFSDDPQAAIKSLDLTNKDVTPITHNQRAGNEHADMWLMSHCRHFIIPNSTFSWWGAWLARSGSKLVIAPGTSDGSPTGLPNWDFKGLIPSDWVTVEARE